MLGCSEIACSLFCEDEQSKIMYNAYDSDKFIWDEESQKESHPFKFIQVGRYSPVKNQNFSLHILKTILPLIPEATLDLVGAKGDDAECELRKVAVDLGVIDKVQFHPADADIPALLRRADVFLLPSLNEGFGIALIEAQAVGLRCYASDTVPRATNCGGVTYLSLSDGVSMWAQIIASDYQSGKHVHQQYDCSQYSMDNVMSEYKKIYGGSQS